MFSRNKIMPKLNYDSDTTGYYSSSSLSDSTLSRSQFILRPSSGASSIYQIESPSLQTDYYEVASCRSALSSVSTIEESVYRDQRVDSNFADADDEMSTARPLSRLESPPQKNCTEGKPISGKNGHKPLRSHSILLRLDTDRLESPKPQYNSLRRIKEKVTNSIRNFKSESPKTRLFEKREKLYTTRASSATSNFMPAYSDSLEATVYNGGTNSSPNSSTDYSILGYSNILPARTRSCSQMSGSHYCQTIYLPSFVPQLFPEEIEANEAEESLTSIAFKLEKSSLEKDGKLHKHGNNGLDLVAEDPESSIADFPDTCGEAIDFWREQSQISFEEVSVEEVQDNLHRLSPNSQLECFEAEDLDTQHKINEVQPRYENETCSSSSERTPETEFKDNDKSEDGMSLHSYQIESEVQSRQDYLEPDSPTTISSSYLNVSEENLGQLFDEVELMQQIEKELSLRPRTSIESTQILRRNKVFIKVPDEDCKIYFDQKLKNFKRIGNKVPNPKSILKKNPAPCHIYEEIQNDYLEPYPCDIRPTPPQRPVVVPNNIFQPCTSFSTNMFKCGRYPAILRKKKLPSLHLFSATRKKTK